MNRRENGSGFIQYNPGPKVGEIVNAVWNPSNSSWLYNVRFKDGTTVDGYNFDNHEVIFLA